MGRVVRERAAKIARNLEADMRTRRFQIQQAPGEKRLTNYPVFSDILLLKDTVRFVPPAFQAPEIIDLGVVGTPPTGEEGGNPPRSQRLDMLIRSQVYIVRLKKFFREVCQCRV
jgi:hypothetical protein